VDTARRSSVPETGGYNLVLTKALREGRLVSWVLSGAPRPLAHVEVTMWR
jgi:hypothetical protein